MDLGWTLIVVRISLADSGWHFEGSKSLSKPTYIRELRTRAHFSANMLLSSKGVFLVLFLYLSHELYEENGVTL